MRWAPRFLAAPFVAGPIAWIAQFVGALIAWIAGFVAGPIAWIARFVAALITWVALTVLAYLAVPPHAAMLAAVRAQCAPLPRPAYAACTASARHGLIGWTGRGVIVGIALAVVVFAVHPWWTRRRHDLAPLGDTAADLRTELTRLTGPGRQPAWLLAPYAYTERSRAFGPPWRPSVRIDVGLGILFRTDRPRFRAVVAGELDRLRDRAAGTRYLTAGCLVTLAAAVPAAGPAPHPSSSIDACLPGYWTEEPRTQPMLLPDNSAGWVTRHGAIWSFTASGTATLFLGDETLRTVAHRGTGTIRWRMTTPPGRLELTEPVVTAGLTDPDGVIRVPAADEFALPGAYTCDATTATMSGDLDVTVLHRVGP